jgi:hypothetical protein
MRRRFSPLWSTFGIFKELITHTSGDFDEAIDWLRELDTEYKLTDGELHHSKIFYWRFKEKKDTSKTRLKRMEAQE